MGLKGSTIGNLWYVSGGSTVPLTSGKVLGADMITYKYTLTTNTWATSALRRLQTVRRSASVGHFCQSVLPGAGTSIPTRRRDGCTVTVGQVMYYMGGYYGPDSPLTSSTPYTSGNTNRVAVEMLRGGVSPTAVPTTLTPTTLAPSFAPTAYSTTEPWTTKKAMPLSGMEDVGQSCAGVTSATGSFYYQYHGNSPFGPFPTTADMMKYTAATDAWSLGNRPSPCA
jgi:hypothetical protein